MLELYAALRDSAGSLEFQAPVPAFYALWMPPEAFAATQTADSLCSSGPDCDVYSVGVILHEISTRNGPFDVDLTNPTAVESNFQGMV